MTLFLLWDDARTDEDQLGMTYARLEKAMKLSQKGKKDKTLEEKSDLVEYQAIRAKNLQCRFA